MTTHIRRTIKKLHQHGTSGAQFTARLSCGHHVDVILDERRRLRSGSRVRCFACEYTAIEKIRIGKQQDEIKEAACRMDKDSPVRQVVARRELPSGTYLTLSCGHAVKSRTEEDQRRLSMLCRFCGALRQTDAAAAKDADANAESYELRAKGTPKNEDPPQRLVVGMLMHPKKGSGILLSCGHLVPYSAETNEWVANKTVVGCSICAETDESSESVKAARERIAWFVETSTRVHKANVEAVELDRTLDNAEMPFDEDKDQGVDLDVGVPVVSKPRVVSRRLHDLLLRLDRAKLDAAHRRMLGVKKRNRNLRMALLALLDADPKGK